MKFLVFGAKREQPVQVCAEEQSEKNVFVDKKTKKNRNWETFFQNFGRTFCPGSQKCNLSVHKSIFLGITSIARIFYFVFVFLLAAEAVPTPEDFFSSFFSKLDFWGQVNSLNWRGFLKKVVVFILKFLGTDQKKSILSSNFQCRWEKHQSACPK